MPFKGTNPYGTNGGSDSLDLPQTPPDVRIVEGGGFVGYLLINGPVTERLREQIEQIVRTLGTRGQVVTGVIIRDDGAVIDSDLAEMNFGEGISVTTVSPGVVYIRIPENAIGTAYIADDAITPAKLEYPTPTMNYGLVTPNEAAPSGNLANFNVSLSAGNWNHFIVFNLQADGDGLADGTLIIKHGSSDLIARSARYEVGVDTTHLIIATGVRNIAVSGTQNFSGWWTPTANSINAKGGQITGLFWKAS